MDKKKSIMILLLSFGIVGIYGFPYMKGTFYNVMKSALELSDFQLSRIWSVFGTVGMLSYVGGGYFTDRISPKRILITALMASSILHLYVSFIPSYFVLLVISGLMGLTAVFAFFPASSKVLSCLGNEHDAGVVFGIYYSLEGLGGMIVNLAGSRMFAITGDEMQTFTLIVRIYALLNLIAAVGIYFKFSEIEMTNIQGNQVSFSEIKNVFRNKQVWLIAGITLCNFWLYCSLTYITPYLTDVYGISNENTLIYGIIRVNILTVLAAILFGKLADKRRSALEVIWKIMPVQGIVLGFLIGNEFTFRIDILSIVLTMAYAFIATGVKTICLVLISESEFPMLIVGTVIGVVSFIGYSPDAFLYPIAGKLLETYQEQGYFYLFMICLLTVIASILCCRALWKVRRDDHEKRGIGVSDITRV